MPRTVAILGAGPSGLVSAKEAIENGLTPTVFEKQKELGGVWNPSTGAVWETMRTNISKFSTTFGDTEYDDDTEMFPNSRTVFEYLQNYAKKWKIFDTIKFETEVVKVEPLPSDQIYGSNGWKVTWRTNDNALQSEIYDAIIVCSGIFALENSPTFPGIESFPGQILHSKSYKSGEKFKDLNVLTIGGSLSGAEIAADVANDAKTSFHSFRRSFWILRRYLSDKERKGAKIPVDLLLYNRKFYLQDNADSNLSQEAMNVKKNKGLLTMCQDQQNYLEIGVPLNNLSQPMNIVISDNYLPCIESGQLVPIKSEVKKIHGSTVIFEGSRKIENIDAIIFATGFRMNIPFFPEAVQSILKSQPEDQLQPLILFQECVHPDLRNLFFVGMYKGPYFAVMEQQARWACRVLSSKITLPSRDVMIKGLEAEEKVRQEVPRQQFPHPDYVLFADTIASFGKSFPNLEALRAEDHSLTEVFEPVLNKPSESILKSLEHRKEEIATHFMTSPVTPSHYNFHDPKNAVRQMGIVDHVLQQFSNNSM